MRSVVVSAGVATTVFNAVYEAGYPIERRNNHSLYIASYPEGRDAAIAYPDIDLVWRNDTESECAAAHELHQFIGQRHALWCRPRI